MFKISVTIHNPVFSWPDENKIEVEDERGRKKNSHNPMFSFYPNQPNPVFSI